MMEVQKVGHFGGGNWVIEWVSRWGGGSVVVR